MSENKEFYCLHPKFTCEKQCSGCALDLPGDSAQYPSHPLPEEREPVYRVIKMSDRRPPYDKYVFLLNYWPTVLGPVFLSGYLKKGEYGDFIQTYSGVYDLDTKLAWQDFFEWLEQIPAPIPQPVSKETETELYFRCNHFLYDSRCSVQCDECKPKVAPPIPESLPTEIPEEIEYWIRSQTDKVVREMPLRSVSLIGHEEEDVYKGGYRDAAIAMYRKLQEDWFNKGPAGYSMALAAIQKGIFSREKQIKALQAYLSSMKAERDNAESNYLRAYTERDEAYIENRKLARDRDLYRFESEKYRKAWEEATFVLGERNVENRELKTLIGEMIHYLALDTGFKTDGHVVDHAATILYKFSKKDNPL